MAIKYSIRSDLHTGSKSFYAAIKIVNMLSIKTNTLSNNFRYRQVYKMQSFAKPRITSCTENKKLIQEKISKMKTHIKIKTLIHTLGGLSC